MSRWTTATETVLIIRYEDIIAEPTTQLKLIASTMGWQLSDSRIEEIVTYSTKEKMREFEQSHGIPLHRVGEDKIARWRDGFTPSVEHIFASGLNDQSRIYLSKDH